MLYTLSVLMFAYIRTLLFVGHTEQTQTVIQIAPFYAIVIAVAITLMGILIGVWAGWFLTGQDLKRAKLDNERLTEASENSKMAQSQITRERDATLRELQDLREQITLVDNQLKSRQRLLDQANDYLQNNDQQLTLAHVNLKQQRQIVEELRTRLIDVEQIAIERHAEIADLQKEVKALRRSMPEGMRGVNG